VFSPWLSFWYQYLVGGALFLIGIFYIWRSGELKAGADGARGYYLILWLGLVGFWGLHLLLMLEGS